MMRRVNMNAAQENLKRGYLFFVQNVIVTNSSTNFGSGEKNDEIEDIEVLQIAT